MKIKNVQDKFFASNATSELLFSPQNWKKDQKIDLGEAAVFVHQALKELFMPFSWRRKF